MKKYIYTLFILTLSIPSFGQQVNNFPLVVSDTLNYKTDTPFTAIAIKGIENFEQVELWINEQEYTLSRNIHFEHELVSNLILFDKNQRSFKLVNKSSQVLKVEVNLLNGAYQTALLKKLENEKLAYKKSDCNLPALIDQDVWREGLDAPKPNPTTTTVSHLIIHHSATTNNVTDYLLAVRNIYLYHTNNNGWDDVGYNYLISPDGTLFAGRDGQGKEDDNIKGAHFCGKNSYTMGVCLIGNYSEIAPPDSMIEKLSALLAWKANKDNLQPLESSFHPKGSSSGFNLPIICGHRDGYKAGVFTGCQTECPGNYTYAILDTVRNKVAKRLIDCGFAVGLAQQEKYNKVLFKNGIVSFSNSAIVAYQITDISGRLIASGKSNQLQMALPKGLFIINTVGPLGFVSTTKVVNY